MTNCEDEGRLRAYLDGELPALERAALGAHIASCAACQGRQAELRAQAQRARALLATPSAGPDPQAALARLRAAGADKQDLDVPTYERSNVQRRPFMQVTSSWSGRRRALLAGMAALVVALSLLLVPPLRAAADSLLSVFRVQKVVFVPISADRVRQLENLNLDGKTLFLDKPTSSDKTPPRTVASAGAAATLAGTTVAEPAQLPGPALSTEYTVTSPGKGQFKVNVATVRQVLEMLDIRDVTIPDALGAGPITVDMQPFVSTRYRGANYQMTLNQGHSPSVGLPEGVDLPQLGKVALRLLGMTPEQAEATSRDINWNNTLLFPFPADTNNLRQVNVGGEKALLVGAGTRGQAHWQLYWQRGETFYMLEGSGMREADMIDALLATAESVR